MANSNIILDLKSYRPDDSQLLPTDTKHNHVQWNSWIRTWSYTAYNAANLTRTEEDFPQAMVISI